MDAEDLSTQTTTPKATHGGLNATQAAEYLGRDRSTLYRWVKSGHIPKHITPGGQPWYDPQELDAVMRRDKE